MYGENPHVTVDGVPVVLESEHTTSKKLDVLMPASSNKINSAFMAVITGGVPLGLVLLIETVNVTGVLERIEGAFAKHNVPVPIAAIPLPPRL